MTRAPQGQPVRKLVAESEPQGGANTLKPEKWSRWSPSKDVVSYGNWPYLMSANAKHGGQEHGSARLGQQCVPGK